MPTHTSPATGAQDADEPTLTLGPEPATDAEVTLSPATLRGGCYIEGDSPRLQTILCHSLLSQVAAMGDGFCYVHPTDDAVDLLRALPEHRLDDVVWIDVYPDDSHLELPDDATHVTIDPLAVDTDATCTTPPASGRTADLLDTLTADAECDWNDARFLAQVADHTARSDRSITDLQTALATAAETAPDETKLFPDWLATAFDTPTPPATTLDDVIGRARRLLDQTLDTTATTALDDTTSCDIQHLIQNDAIVLVSGSLPRGAPTNYTAECRQLATRLCLTTVIRSVWEGLQAAPSNTRCVPLVIDECTRLFEHEPHLFEELLSHGTTHDTPLGLVCCGDSFARFEAPLQFTISRELGTRVVIAEHLPTELLVSNLNVTPALEQLGSEFGRTAGTEGTRPTSWVGQPEGLHTERDPAFRPFQTPVEPQTKLSVDRATSAIRESIAHYGAQD